jgi:hypothetical protein
MEPSCLDRYLKLRPARLHHAYILVLVDEKDIQTRAKDPPSALSQLNFGIDRLEFTSGIVNFHLPIDTALGIVDVV